VNDLASELPLRLGRYVLHREIARGGMATIYLAQLTGVVGFSKTVAIKRLHSHLAKDPEFVTMFADEARLAARVHHPNVASMLDIVAMRGELFLVMEHIHGETVSRLLSTTRGTIPTEIGVAIASHMLHGLHAAHEAKGEDGLPLNLIHRDISPQNVIVGRDGASRLLDFGVARAAGRLHNTEEGKLKGKLPYMAPELLSGVTADKQTDVYAAAVVLWELLAGRKLFGGANEGAILEQIIRAQLKPPSAFAPAVSPALDAVTMKGLARRPEDRFRTAKEMVAALEGALVPAPASVVSNWLEQVASESLNRTDEIISNIERSSSSASRDIGNFLAQLDGPQNSSPESTGEPQAGTSGQPGQDLYTSSALSTEAALKLAKQSQRRPWLALGAVAVTALMLAIVLLATRSDPPTRAQRLPSRAGDDRPGFDDPLRLKAPPAATASATAAAWGIGRPPGPSSSGGPAKPPGKDCNPPYYFEDGKKIWKRECL
jgi:eukaryotic-like serine/threonine-protein kinase